MLSEIFSIPFLICLSISILLIGCSSIYFYQRITQQDHKIESMVSLISSMAEELKGGQPQVKPFSAPVQVPAQVQALPVPMQAKIQSASTLIPVSDGESDSEESDDSDSEISDNSSTYSDSEDDDHIIEIIGSVEGLKEIDESEIEDLEMEEPKTDLEELNVNMNDIKSIHLEDSGNLGSLNDLSLFKSIHISGEVHDDSITVEESTNYKKMPIQRLREIAQLQGHGDVSKLKKNELLKLLGAE
jgi:hypothetical protein